MRRGSSLDRGGARRLILLLLGSPLTWLIVAAALLYQLVVVPHWNPTWDSAIYITLAQSLAGGDGYTYSGYPHTKYPPGFPLLLTPIELLFGHQFLLMRVLIAACAVGSIGLTYVLMQRLLDRKSAVVISVLTGSSYALLSESTRILSDVPYMLASLAALVVAERSCRDLSRRWAVVSVAMIVAACSIRVVGFTLALAVACSLLLDRRGLSIRRQGRHAVVVLVTMALVAGLWMGRNAMVSEHLPAELREALSYERELIVTNPIDPHSPTIDSKGLAIRLQKNALHYEKLLANLLTSKNAQSTTFVHVLAAWWVLGWVIALVRRRSVIEYYTLFYAGIHLFWPSWQGARFLVPILPMLFYYALQPLLLFFDRVSQVERNMCASPRYEALEQRDLPGLFLLGRVVPIARVLALAGIVLFSLELSAPELGSIIRTERRDPYYRGRTANYIRAMEWTRDHTPLEAVIITDQAPWAHLLSGRRAFSNPRVKNQEEVLASIERNGGTHVIANNRLNSLLYLQPVIEAHPERFTQVHRIGSSVVYEFVAGATAR